MEIIKFLTACALVEEKAAQIYHEMAAVALAGNDTELGAVWKQMAADEEDHAQQLRLAARLSRENIFARLDSAEEAAPNLLVERAETLLNYVKTGRLSEVEMLKVAVDLEKKFQKMHAACAISFHEPTMKKMFDSLARADKQHTAGLKDRIARVAKSATP